MFDSAGGPGREGDQEDAGQVVCAEQGSRDGVPFGGSYSVDPLAKLKLWCSGDGESVS